MPAFRTSESTATCEVCSTKFTLKQVTRRLINGRCERYYVRRRFCPGRCTRQAMYRLESQREQLDFCPVCEQEMDTDAVAAHIKDAHRRCVLDYEINRNHEEWLRKLRLLEADEDTSVQDLLFAHSWQQRFHLPRTDYGKLHKRGRRMYETENVLRIRKNMITKILRDAITGE